MPIKSYLAHPQPDQKKDLEMALNELENCEIIPSQSHDIIIIVTDTHSELEDKELEDKIYAIKSLRLLTVVAGFETENKEKQ
ncbi:hypothetical protein UJ101_02460 [Flavobacteriaceae bacterium UJ101]|nr:hypothetical protein UJ101_02460 [Flavobacteriaceae bacterium UJ101]